MKYSLPFFTALLLASLDALHAAAKRYDPAWTSIAPKSVIKHTETLDDALAGAVAALQPGDQLVIAGGRGEGMYLCANHGEHVMSESVIALNHIHECRGDQGDDIKVKQGSWGNLVAEKEVQDLSLHCPPTTQTRGMIGAAELALLPGGAIVVNTARGGGVDTAAVVTALADGHLAGAGIDVLEQEPPPEDSPVLRTWRDPNHPAHDHLLLNPHTAFYCEEGSEEFRIKGSQEVLRTLQGRPLRNQVN